MLSNPAHTRDVDYRNRRGGPAKGPSVLLGLSSAALGAGALARPNHVAALLGVRADARSRLALRLVGVREMASAAGLLVRRHPERWMWARVGGDVVDLVLLTAASRAGPASRQRVAIARVVLMIISLTDLLAALRVHRADGGTGGDAVVRARVAVTVDRPAQELYSFWRDLERLPSFMEHLHSVQVTGAAHSHWRARGPAGRSVEWDATIIGDRPGELIAWQSEPGARVPNRGSVRFAPAPGNRGTVVTVDLQYEPPGGAAGSLLARMLGEEPVQQVKDDMRRFKQMVETGEIARSEASPDGTEAGRQARQRPARAQSNRSRH